MRQDLLRRSFGDDLAAVLTGGRTQVHDPVCFTDGFIVMFDDQDSVAQVAQALECLQQPGVVARVQANRRLVEHIQHADQPRADLRGQADALGFAAR